MALADITAKLRLDATDFSRKITQASMGIKKFAVATNNAYGDMAASLKRHTFELKDTARIVQGIVVAQTFYAGARAINNAADALMDFNEKLDYTRVTYAALFGDTSLANGFVKTLQQAAVNSIFDYDTLALSSKRLLAYGIEYKNLMYIMNGLTNLGALTGDTEALDRISYALGQIYAKGKLTAEEMRQLANAYIPIQRILQERLGVTGEDLGKVGELNIPAETAINAIIDYANDNFAVAGKAAMNTITGLKNRIVDSAKVLGSEMTAPLTNAWKSFLKYIADGLENVKSLYRQGGFGAIFEALVPDPNMQTTIRAFIANIINLLRSLLSIFGVVKEHIGQAMQALMTSFNIIAPLINNSIAALGNFVNALLKTSAGATVLRTALYAAGVGFIFMRLHALKALVVTAVAKAVTALSKALMLLSAILASHPILTLVGLLAAGLVGVAVASNNANNSLANLFRNLSGLGGGTTQDDVLQKMTPDIDDADDAMDRFNERLGDASGNAKDLGDNLNKAAKAAKGLLSFDEVFKLNEGGGAGSNESDWASIFDDLDIGGGGIDLNDLIPDIADFEEYAKNFIDKLKTSLFGKLAVAGLGALLAKKLLDAMSTISASGLAPGAKAIAMAIGNALLGAAIGVGYDAIASLITDKLWDFLEEKIKLKAGSAENARLGSTIGSVIGGAIGSMIGGPLGGLAGAAIGQLVGGLTGLTKDEAGKGYMNAITMALSGIGSAIAKAFGASLGTVAKTLVNTGSVSGFFSSIGGILKAVGFKALLKGGVIGVAIGLLTDGIAALLWTGLSEKFSLGAQSQETAKLGQTIGSLVGAVIGGLLGGPAGAMIGSAVGTFAGGLVGVFWEPIKTWFESTANTVYDWSRRVSKDFGAWFTDTAETVYAWSNNTRNKFVGWFVDTAESVYGWSRGTREEFLNWFADTAESVYSWANSTRENFFSWFADTAETVYSWANSTREAFFSWFADTAETVYGWSNDTRQSLTDWATGVQSSITTGMMSFIGAIVTGLTTTQKEWSAKLASILSTIAKWWSDLRASTVTWLEEKVWQPIADFFNPDKFWQRISESLTGIKNKFTNWWKDVVSGFDLVATVNTAGSGIGVGIGHATGGIFSREHVARVAENNRPEAIIPLSNATAMQPFVDAVAAGITQSLAPVLAASGGDAATLQPLYVGTLIADDRSLKELSRRMQVIQIKESQRRA